MGQTSVLCISHSMRVYDSDDWFGDDIVNESFSYQPK